MNEIKNILFEATITSVYHVGFHGCSIALIAKEAHTHPSNIYHYFTSKEDLIIECFNYVKQQTEAYIFNRLEKDSELSYQKSFYLIFNLYIHFFKQKPYHLSYLEQFGKSPYLKKAQETNEYIGCIRKFLQKGIDQNIFICKDLKIIKTLILGAINEITFHIFNEENQNYETQINSVLEMIWNGITTQTVKNTYETTY